MFFDDSSLSSASAITLPALSIVGYSGTLASLASLGDWLLCDGNNGTPNLSDKFLLGTGAGYSLNQAGGGKASQIAGTTTTDGAHGNIGGLGPGAGGSGGEIYRSGVGGAHAHGVIADMDWQPPAQQTAFIISRQATRLPPGAIAWLFGTAAPPGFSEYVAAQDRLLVGRVDDARAQVGSGTRNISNVRFQLAGDHVHPSSVYYTSGSANHPNQTGGAHTHPAGSAAAITVANPPYLVMLALQADGVAGAVTKLVVAYAGSIATLPAGWLYCDGTGGTPNMGGRFALGKGAGSLIGDTGGSLALVPVTGDPVPNTTATHNHDSGSSALGAAIGDHSDYAWSHSHAGWSGSADPTPPFRALHHIMYSL